MNVRHYNAGTRFHLFFIIACMIDAGVMQKNQSLHLEDKKDESICFRLSFCIE